MSFTTKAGFILLLGETNAGKSTFLNTVIGQKVSIVSHKVQTTRFKILGIHTQSNIQLIFIDTPGIFKAQRDYDKEMLKLSYGQIKEADIVMLLIDAKKGITEQTKQIISHLNKKQKNIVALNKIDLVNKTLLLEQLTSLQEFAVFQEYFLISATKNDGIDKLLNYLQNNVTENPFFFDEDQISDLDLNKMATEITREKIYKFLNQELPYNIGIEHVSWQENDIKIVIHQNVYVSKANYKAIILGHKGEKIKSIRKAAMEEMTTNFHKKVNLYLTVKVDENLFNKRIIT